MEEEKTIQYLMHTNDIWKAKYEECEKKLEEMQGKLADTERKYYKVTRAPLSKKIRGSIIRFLGGEVYDD